MKKNSFLEHSYKSMCANILKCKNSRMRLSIQEHECNRPDYYPFVVTSTISWERESMTTLNISSLHIYSRLLSDVNNGILQIFIAVAIRYGW